jgi:hypothetical protein
MSTTDLSFGSVKRLIGRAVNPNVGTHMSVDDCVRSTTAFRDLADMLDTQPSYSPKFCISRRSCTDAERNAMLRAARAFNYACEKAGQARRALIF